MDTPLREGEIFHKEENIIQIICDHKLTNYTSIPISRSAKLCALIYKIDQHHKLSATMVFFHCFFLLLLEFDALEPSAFQKQAPYLLEIVVNSTYALSSPDPS